MDALMLHEDANGFLFHCDSVWGDDPELFNLLNCDLALDEELPNLLDEAAQQPTLLRGATSVPPAPQADSSRSGCSSPAILLPAAACKGPPARRSHSPAFSGQWRTVTTTATPGDKYQNKAASVSMLAALSQACIGLDLAPMPSSDTSGLDITPTLAVDTQAPPATDGRMSVVAFRPRGNSACCKSDSSKQPLDMDVVDDTDSEDSNDTGEHVSICDGVTEVQGQTARPNKRKAPEIDWRSIDDPAERRRQRRLAKNRVTAARSRERKKSQWAEMEEKLNSMEAENRSLREMLESVSKDNEALRAQLAAALGPQAGAAAAGSTAAAAAKGGKHTEPAVLLLIATLLLLCAFLPNSSNSTDGQQQQALGPAMLGAAVLLADMLRRLNTRSDSRSWSSRHVAYSEHSHCCMTVDSAPDSISTAVYMLGHGDGWAGGAELQPKLGSAAGSSHLHGAPACGLAYLWQALGAVLTCLLTAVDVVCGNPAAKSLVLKQHRKLGRLAPRSQRPAGRLFQSLI